MSLLIFNKKKNPKVYTEAADQINKSDRLFSQARAQTIAVTEIWKAYEYWNYEPIRQLSWRMSTYEKILAYL